MNPLKLDVDDLIHQIIQFGDAVGGLPVAFLRGHSFVITLVAGIGFFHYRSVLLLIVPSGGSQ